MRKIYSEFNNVSVSSESGTSEWYNKIQEAATGTTLPELIAKYESGEIKDFNFKQGQYLDLSELPTSAMETLNLLRGIDNLDVINDYLKTLSDGSKKIKKVLFSLK